MCGAERDRVEEQSHKDEMRAALRGDFERMRRRQAGEREPPDPFAPRADVPEVGPQDVVADSPAGSWLERILGRA